MSVIEQYARRHQEGCAFKRAVTCAIGIECPHGRDVCPICDACTCGKTVKGPDILDVTRDIARSL